MNFVDPGEFSQDISKPMMAWPLRCCDATPKEGRQTSLPAEIR